MRTALILHRSKYPVFLRQASNYPLGDWRFVENDLNPSVEYDAVIVYSNVSAPIRVRSKTKPILITGEPEPVLRYPRSFTDQFGLVVTTQESIQNSNVLRHATCTPWFIGVSAGTVTPWANVEYQTLGELLARGVQEKTRPISMITSIKALTKGHRARLRFGLTAARAFPRELDLFGHGLRTISDKGEALWNYRYHIAVENCVSKNYWTEKIADPLLAKSYPIYHGCPNIFDYFPDGAARIIDIFNPREALASIRQLLHDGLSKSEEEAMLTGRELVIGRYNFVNFLADVLRDCRYTPPALDAESLEITPFTEEWVHPTGVLDKLAFRALAWRVPRALARIRS